MSISAPCPPGLKGDGVKAPDPLYHPRSIRERPLPPEIRRSRRDMNTIRTVDDIKRLPFITKDEVRENFPDGIVARGVNREACHYSPPPAPPADRCRSSSRSKPLLFTSPGVRMYTMIGYRPWHRMAYIKYTDLHYPRLGPFFQTTHIKSTIPLRNRSRNSERPGPTSSSATPLSYGDRETRHA